MDTDELIDILDSEGNTIGSCLKSEAHQKGYWHPCAHIWLYTKRGEVLIQKRSPKKDAFPNLWDISVAGHISSGELPIVAAQRELYEELGIRQEKNNFEAIGTFKCDFRQSEDYIDREFSHIFISELKLSLDELKLQEEEVDEIRLIPISRLKTEMGNKATIDFVPYGTTYFSKVFGEILNRL